VVLLNTEPARAAAVTQRIVGEQIHAPHLIDLEVAQTLRELVLRHEIAAESARLMLNVLAAMRIARHDHTSLLPRIWELRHNITSYDAAYIALAESLDAPLITADGPLSRAPGHHAVVEVF
jgi:predicted nucleic acid-binding protein